MGTSTTRVILFGTIPIAIPTTVPIVDTPVVHDDTPLILYQPDHSSSDHFSSDVSSLDSPSDSPSGYSSDTSSGHYVPDYSFDTPAVSFASPSFKRRRPLIISAPLALPIPGALSLVHADLLPPRKRIRGSANIDADIAAAEAVAASEADVGVEVSIGSNGEDEAEEEDRGTIEIGVDRIIEGVQMGIGC
ncbi:hypothetical protein Tco_0625647 [Tanacetum coccineum]|uniref:Uncharacterized protein n=1 Tax=Tanacetum coccineum TaxID=301880 RepID=A0ABQ4WHH3_9ASTR